MSIKLSSEAAAKRRIILKLDAIAREKCFERDRRRDGLIMCQSCRQGQLYQPHWAHILSRRDLSIRWEADNALSLCERCHDYFDNHKTDSLRWFETCWPERMAHIRELQQSHQMFGNTIESLKELLAEMSNGHHDSH